MTKDNITGRNHDFYDKGKKMFDRIQVLPEHQTMAATPYTELIAELMNPNIPKNERERLRETRQAIIAGALLDFMAWLTSRKERLVLSSADEAGPAVDAIRDFAKMRGLSLDDARVLDWQSTPNRQWVGLTEWEREAIAHECGAMSADWLVFMEAVERALREKNT